MAYYSICTISNKGKVRTNNEDNFFSIGRYMCNSLQDECVCEGEYRENETIVEAVFDGMGGTEAGEIASFVSAKEMKDYVEGTVYEKHEFSGNQAIFRMNQKVCKVCEDKNMSMGAAVVFAYIKEDKVTVYNLGDSRAYFYRDGQMKQISLDHTEESMILRLQEQYGIFVTEKKNLNRNALTQYLGVKEEDFILEPAISEPIELQNNDLILLCSDGLYSEISEEKISVILSENMTIKDKVIRLKNEALLAGGKDNITIILIEKKE